MTTMLSRVALITVAAVAVYAPALGLPLPESCAGPSPSCGGDLRECLRQSADLRQTTFGGRYVTAEDVARCVEAFNSCIHGGASSGGNVNPPKSTPPTTEGEGALPKRFAINGQYEAYDCSVNGAAVSCTVAAHSSAASADYWSAAITGTASGMSVTGTMTIDQRMEANGCVMEDHGSGPWSAVFDAGGSVSLREGPFQWQRKPVSCANWDPWTQPGYEATGTWAPK